MKKLTCITSPTLFLPFFRTFNTENGLSSIPFVGFSLFLLFFGDFFWQCAPSGERALACCHRANVSKGVSNKTVYRWFPPRGGGLWTQNQKTKPRSPGRFLRPGLFLAYSRDGFPRNRPFLMLASELGSHVPPIHLPSSAASLVA